MMDALTAKKLDTCLNFVVLHMENAGRSVTPEHCWLMAELWMRRAQAVMCGADDQ